MHFTLLLHGYDKDGNRVGVWETPVISFGEKGSIDFDYRGGHYELKDHHADHRLKWMLRNRACICKDLFRRPEEWTEESEDRTHVGLIREIYHRFEVTVFEHIVPYGEARIVSIVVMGINVVPYP